MSKINFDNKPPYKFFKNFSYALSGIKDVFHNETSFKLDLLFFIIFSILSFLTPFEFVFKLILLLSLFLPILSELINSALERLVDLYTLDFNIQAKRIKDIGASLVLLSFLITTTTWILIFIYNIEEFLQ